MQEIEFRNKPFERVMAMAVALCVCVCVYICVCDDIVDSSCRICALNCWAYTATNAQATTAVSIRRGSNSRTPQLAAQVWNVKCVKCVCMCVCVQNGHIESTRIVRSYYVPCLPADAAISCAHTHTHTHQLGRKLWHAHFNHLPFPAVAWHKYSRHDAALHKLCAIVNCMWVERGRRVEEGPFKY